MSKCCSGQSQSEATAPNPSAVPSGSQGQQALISAFKVPKMDCPSEERMIRMALASSDAVLALDFDLPQRALRITHHGGAAPLLARLIPLGFGAELVETKPAGVVEIRTQSQAEVERESKTLRVLLAINAVMFLVEIIAGVLAQSTGLLADSLDMFADAAVYGLALYAVGRTAQHKLRVAHLAGWLEMALAIGALTEVLRRFVFGSAPESSIMMTIALVALLANVSCLALLSGHKDGGAHMRASWIFSSNDVIANLGVILAGALVAWTSSPLPDLIIGTLIALVVLNGARRILMMRA
ncbi:MAG: cation transporter [Moraxellaceae bacterium]|nr:cation transporter [Moraxellaceae bacterium]MDZ4385643.1 cation transporter [Moraxellaceae bacterium]